jgi:chitinase
MCIQSTGSCRAAIAQSAYGFRRISLHTALILALGLCLAVIIPLCASPAWSALSDKLSEDQFDALFPNRNSLYTYAGLISAAADYPAFANQGTATQQLQDLAAFFANIGHETTGGWPTAEPSQYAWGLYYKQEADCTVPANLKFCEGYCLDSQTWQCVANQYYVGRGPMQLSYNTNYGPAGHALSLNLLSNPDLVTATSENAFLTAIWFWMEYNGGVNGRPTPHQVMSGLWTPTEADIAAGRLPGFGMTINIINGGVECGHPPKDNTLDRIGYYTQWMTTNTVNGGLGVDPGANLSCETMKPYQ